MRKYSSSNMFTVYFKAYEFDLRQKCVFCEDKRTFFKVYTEGMFQRCKYNPAKSFLHKSWM